MYSSSVCRSSKPKSPPRPILSLLSAWHSLDLFLYWGPLPLMEDVNVGSASQAEPFVAKLIKFYSIGLARVSTLTGNRCSRDML